MTDTLKGAIAESWIIIVHSQTLDTDGVSGYRILTSDTQPHHVDRGLLDVGQAIVAASWDDNLYEDDDDE